MGECADCVCGYLFSGRSTFLEGRKSEPPKIVQSDGSLAPVNLFWHPVIVWTTPIQPHIHPVKHFWLPLDISLTVPEI